MEIQDVESTIDCIIAQRQSVKKLMADFNLLEEDSTLDYASFRKICTSLFRSDEIEKHEYKIQKIFKLFDLDEDGVLKERERNLLYKWLRVIMEPVHALLVVDVQNDFIDGSLALRSCGCNQDGLDVLEPINRLLKEGHFHKVIYSLDWHPEDHISFYENLYLRDLHPDSKVTKETAKPFDTVLFTEPRVEQTLWPKHCVMNTWGSELHKDLIVASDSVQIRKGQNSELEVYSAFLSNTSDDSSELQRTLQEAGVTHLYVCGLAYDVCVKASCLDGLKLGYAIAVIDDCCRGTNLHDIESAKKMISESGGLVLNSDDVLPLVNEDERSLIMSYQSAKAVALT